MCARFLTCVIYQLLGLFNDSAVSQCSADGFYILMSTSEDVMTNSFCANVKVGTSQIALLL